MILIAAIIVGVVLILCWWIGLFDTATVQTTYEGGYTLVGKEYTGSYSNAGKNMADVTAQLNREGAKYTRGFGVYYDNPRNTPPEQLRSFVGGILDEKDSTMAPQLREKGFKVESMQRGQALVVSLPLRTNLTYIIGTMKAYPALNKYLQEKNLKSAGAAMEIYDGKQIVYIMPLRKE